MPYKLLPSVVKKADGTLSLSNATFPLKASWKVYLKITTFCELHNVITYN